MDKNKAYKLFDEMIKAVSLERVVFTKKYGLSVKQKKDRTLVSKCDIHLDKIAGDIAQKSKLPIISEERENDLNILRKESYITIDALDGTLGYIKHTKSSNNLRKNFINNKLGPEYDFCFLAAIIIDGEPKFGCCYNYVTNEAIFLDSKGYDLFFENTPNLNVVKYAHYMDNRAKDKLNKELLLDRTITTYKFSSLGKASLSAQLTGHRAAVIFNFTQPNGLWDISVACTAAKFTKAKITNGFGENIKFTDYLLIPKGVVIYAGDDFYIRDVLKKKNMNLPKFLT